jgi:hypothetical protein
MILTRELNQYELFARFPDRNSELLSWLADQIAWRGTWSSSRMRFSSLYRQTPAFESVGSSRIGRWEPRPGSVLFDARVNDRRTMNPSVTLQLARVTPDFVSASLIHCFFQDDRPFQPVDDAHPCPPG